jgi:hypothetical protein
MIGIRLKDMAGLPSLLPLIFSDRWIVLAGKGSRHGKVQAEKYLMILPCGPNRRHGKSGVGCPYCQIPARGLASLAGKCLNFEQPKESQTLERRFPAGHRFAESFVCGFKLYLLDADLAARWPIAITIKKLIFQNSDSVMGVI